MVSINNRFDGLAAKLDVDRLSSTRPQRNAEDESSASRRTSGSEFSVEMTLESGTKVEFSVKQGVGGQVSDIVLYASQPLTDKEKAVFETLVMSLAEGIDQLFSGRAGGRTDLFQSIADAPVDDLEITATHRSGYLSQSLTLDQEERRSGETRLQSDWEQNDLDAGISDRHGFDILKKPGAVAQAYGQVDTGWLEEKLAAATSVLGATRNLAGGLQSEALSSYYGSGLNALLQAVNDGSRALQDIGASADEARHVVDHTLNALSQKAMAAGGDERGGVQATPDFDGTFTSNRTQGFSETGPGTYNFDLTLAQKSHTSYDADEDTQSVNQRRELSLSYRTENEQQRLSLSWSSEERQRFTLIDGQIQTSEQRREESLQWLIEGLRGRADGYQRLVERYNVDYNQNNNNKGVADLGNDGHYRSQQKKVNYQV